MGGQSQLCGAPSSSQPNRSRALRATAALRLLILLEDFLRRYRRYPEEPG
jgi:hypothetical protein